MIDQNRDGLIDPGDLQAIYEQIGTSCCQVHKVQDGSNNGEEMEMEQEEDEQGLKEKKKKEEEEDLTEGAGKVLQGS